MKRERYTWVTLVPTGWLLICTLTAGWQKIFSSDPRIGFFALASKYSQSAAGGTVIAPAKSVAQMQQVAFNNYLCGTITAVFVTLVVIMAYFTIRMSLQALRSGRPTAQEAPYQGRKGVPEYATAV
jgi:carbon starvation protein